MNLDFQVKECFGLEKKWFFLAHTPRAGAQDLSFEAVAWQKQNEIVQEAQLRKQ